MKVCNHCKEEKDVSLFLKQVNGFSCNCKECTYALRKIRDDLRREEINERKRFNKDHIREKYQAYKRHDKVHGVINDIDYEYVKEQLNNPCYYCESTDIMIGLDRKNSSLGHTKENCVPCCYRCNLFKSNIPYEAWMHIVEKVREAVKLGLFLDWGTKHFSLEHAKKEVKKDLCSICGKDKFIFDKFCSKKCREDYKESIKDPFIQKYKIDWSKYDLEELYKTNTMEQIGKDLGVSDNAVRKRMIKQGLSVKPKTFDWSLVDLQKELETQTCAEVAKKFKISKDAVRCRKRYLKNKSSIPEVIEED